jgi:Domain of unknown function (DUF4270)
MKIDLNRARTVFLSRIPVIAGGGTKLFLALAILAFAACKKETDIGAEILPDDELIDLQATDTLTLLTYAVREDSLRTDEAPIVQLGSYVDPQFGSTSASLYTQVSIPNNRVNIDFGSGAVLDSAVLWISYDYDYYGDTSDQQTFTAYEITESMSKDSSYYSNYTKTTNATAIATTGLFSPRPRTKVVMNGDTVPAALRFPVDLAFASQLFGNDPFSDNAAFLNFFKGFYIRPENGAQGIDDGSLLRFNLQDSLSGLTFYYHNATDTLTFPFVVNSTTPYFSHFDHDYTGANANLLFQLSNPGINTSAQTFIQSAAGIKTRIMFPYLDDLQNLGYPIAINKAELIIKADPANATANLPLNKKIYFTAIDSAGKEFFTPDFFEASDYYGGGLNTSANEYRLNMARYMQALVNGDKANYGIYLKEFLGAQEGRRGVLGSGHTNAGSYQMYLHIVYTRIN